MFRVLAATLRNETVTYHETIAQAELMDDTIHLVVEVSFTSCAALYIVYDRHALYTRHAHQSSCRVLVLFNPCSVCGSPRCGRRPLRIMKRLRKFNSHTIRFTLLSRWEKHPVPCIGCVSYFKTNAPCVGRHVAEGNRHGSWNDCTSWIHMSSRLICCFVCNHLCFVIPIVPCFASFSCFIACCLRSPYL